MSMSKKRLLSWLFLLVFGLAAWQAALPAQADESLIRSQTGLTSDISKAFGSNEKPADIRLTMARIINVVLSFLGVVLVILLVFAGFTYMTAEGNEERTQEALTTIRNAVIGLVIVLAAWILTRYAVIILSKTVNNSVDYRSYQSY